MDIIVDASVIIAVIANEPEKHRLIELTRNVDLIAPRSIHWEIGNAFSAMLKRERITLDKRVERFESMRRFRFDSRRLNSSVPWTSPMNLEFTRTMRT